MEVLCPRSSSVKGIMDFVLMSIFDAWIGLVFVDSKVQGPFKYNCMFGVAATYRVQL